MRPRIAPLEFPAIEGTLIGQWDPADFDGGTGVWADSSGNGHDLSPLSANPAAGTRNGYPTVEFDGTGTDRLRVTYGSAVTQPDTLYAVIALDNAAGGHAITDGTTSADRRVIYWSGSAWQLFSNTGVSATGGNAGVSSVQAIRAEFNGAASELYLDDWDSDVMAGNPGTATSLGLTVGGVFSGTAVPHEGAILYLAHVQNATANDDANIRAFFSEHFGLVNLSAQTATETAIQSALTASTELNNCAVRLQRRNGRIFTASKGTVNTRYITSSTVKPITCAALLWGEQQGWFSRESLIVDLFPEFSALATSEQRNIRMRHLMSFTSGLFVSVNPSASAGWAEFVSDCASLATAAADPDFVPGTQHVYATDQHAIASVGAVNASPYADWDGYMTAFIAATGLFSGATWLNSGGVVFGGNVQISVTAEEYSDFLYAVFDETVLTPALCQDLYADAIPSNPTRTTMHTWFTDVGETGEDWHFGRGIWLEERAEDWTGGAAAGRRISTVGVAGQYCMYDRDLDITVIVTPFFPAASEDFMQGVLFVRSIDSLLTTWAGE